MQQQVVTLDHVAGIELDPANAPFNNIQALHVNYAGLHLLASSVRTEEIKKSAMVPPGGNMMEFLNGRINPLIPNAFNWFAVTLVNYLRLVGLVQLMNANGWKSNALVAAGNREIIRQHCGQYVASVAPEVHKWRNKIAAHFAATDPFKDDNQGTLEYSLMSLVSYESPYYWVGTLQWNTDGAGSNMPKWALTKTFEDLQPRFWPELTIQPLG